MSTRSNVPLMAMRSTWSSVPSPSSLVSSIQVRVHLCSSFAASFDLGIGRKRRRWPASSLRPKLTSSGKPRATYAVKCRSGWSSTTEGQRIRSCLWRERCSRMGAEEVGKGQDVTSTAPSREVCVRPLLPQHGDRPLAHAGVTGPPGPLSLSVGLECDPGTSCSVGQNAEVIARAG